MKRGVKICEKFWIWVRDEGEILERSQRKIRALERESEGKERK